MKCKNPYSQEELEIIRAHYPHGVDVALKHLPGRSRSGLIEKAHQIGVQVSSKARLDQAEKAKIAKMLAEARARVRDRDAAQLERDQDRGGMPAEFVKVSSIFKVGLRYALQEFA